MDRKDIFQLIEHERERQEQLHPLPQLKSGVNEDAELMHNYIVTNEFMAVLCEEFGEVGRALQGEGSLSEELLQLASVCIRWLENMKKTSIS